MNKQMDEFKAQLKSKTSLAVEKLKKRATFVKEKMTVEEQKKKVSETFKAAMKNKIKKMQEKQIIKK